MKPLESVRVVPLAHPVKENWSISEEIAMAPPKDTIYYTNILTKSPSGEWETSEQQFQRELKEGRWVHVGYKTTYHICREWGPIRFGGKQTPRPIREVDMAVCKVYKDTRSTTTYLRDSIKKEKYTAQEWQNMISWNPDLRKYC